MRGFWKNRKGYVMPYVVIFLGIFSIPMLTLTVEITRAMFVEVQLQTAVDAACDAAIQAVDVPYFIDSGVIRLDMGAATTYAYREFNASVINHNINNYSPNLAGVSLLTPDTVTCSSTAVMQWFIPGVPASTLSANSIAQARMSSN